MEVDRFWSFDWAPDEAGFGAIIKRLQK